MHLAVEGTVDIDVQIVLHARKDRPGRQSDVDRVLARLSAGNLRGEVTAESRRKTVSS